MGVGSGVGRITHGVAFLIRAESKMLQPAIPVRVKVHPKGDSLDIESAAQGKICDLPCALWSE